MWENPVSVSGWVSKQIVVESYDGYYSGKKGNNWYIQQYGCISKTLCWQKKPQIKEYTLYGSTYIKFRNQTYESMVVEGRNMEGWGSYCLERITREFSGNKFMSCFGWRILGFLHVKMSRSWTPKICIFYCM